jgi:hypothetical protein
LYGTGPFIATDRDQLVVARTSFPTDGHRQLVRTDEYAIDPLGCARSDNFRKCMPQRLCDCYVHGAILFAGI